jgi:uncharacterized alkaline shock family protein YloU
MSLLDRVLLTVYTLALTGFAAVSLVVSAGYSEPFRAFELAFRTPQGRWTTGLVSLLVLVASVRLLYSAFAQPRVQVVHETELGQVRISRDAVEHLVQRVARQVRGVREVRPRVTIGPDGIVARARIWVSPDVNIPGLAGQVQDELRRAVREVVGVELAALDLAVENITAEARRGRLE